MSLVSLPAFGAWLAAVRSAVGVQIGEASCKRGAGRLPDAALLGSPERRPLAVLCLRRTRRSASPQVELSTERGGWGLSF